MALPCTLQAVVRLPAILSDGMVIQRETTAPVRGWAAPGAHVEVTFRGHTVADDAAPDGAWRVELPPQAPGGPFEMVISDGEALTLHDVYVGDVWVCSGQSNMELSVERVKERYPEEIARSANPYVRFFGVKTAFDFHAPRDDVQSTGWLEANPDNVLKFGAVGYFFARSLEAHLDVPVGIINSAVGGSPIESWMSEQALQAFPEALAEGIRWRDDGLVTRTEAANNAAYADWGARVAAGDAGINAEPPWYDPSVDASDWSTLTLPAFWDEAGLELAHGVAWFRKEFDIPASMVGQPGMLYLGTIVDADETYLNGVKVGNTPYQYPPRRYKVPEGLLKEGRNVIVIRAFRQYNRGSFTRDKPFHLVVDGQQVDLRGEWRYKVGGVVAPPAPTTAINWKPMGLYNAMMAPLTHQPVKGVLWYQGESNLANPQPYSELLTAMIADWRAEWGCEALPFIWVQLPNFNPPAHAPAESNWAVLRDLQRRALSIPHTGMAVTIDVGEWNDIHPLNKQAVGERLALEARRVAYREIGVVSSGPLPKSLRKTGRRLWVSFDNIDGGLVAGDHHDTLRHFALAGPDGVFHAAEARIVADEVVVWSDAVRDPVTVRYAWADNPAGINLFNAEGLPASPFQLSIK